MRRFFPVDVDRYADLKVAFFPNKCETNEKIVAQFFQISYIDWGAVMRQEVLVVTNCTNRKRATGATVAFGNIDTSGLLRTVAARWVSTIGKVRPERQAKSVYMGRGFAEARHVAEILPAALFIVSAGLGVVSAEEQIPSYDLTVANGPNSLKSLLADLGQQPSNWWTALTAELGAQRSLHALLERHAGNLALIALPGSYVALIAQDLASLTGSQIDRVRIITSEHGQAYVPEHMRHVVMPYDERLEGSLHAGTRVDFAQRALRHFVEVLHGHRLSAGQGRSAVVDAMRTLTKPLVPVRQKKTDAEILALLRENWNRFGGASNRLLRYLRDDVLVACEQGRFRGLWCSVQQELVSKR